MKFDIGRTVKYVFLFHLSALILITVYTFFTLNRIEIAVLSTPYRIITIFSIYSNLFLSVTAGALFMVLAVSAETEGRYSGSQNFIFSSLPVFLPSVLLYAFLVFYADPRLAESADWFKQLSAAGSFYLKEADRLEKAGEMDKAVHFADLYLFIDPDNSDVNKKRTEMRIELLKNTEVRNITPEEAEQYSVSAAEIFTGEKLISFAEKFMSEGDFPTAVHFAGMARSFKGSVKKAENLIKKAEEKMRNIDRAETPERQLYDGKTRLQRLMDEEDYTQAYSHYHRLKVLFPQDRELTGMGETLFSHLSESCFFYEEFLDFFSAPGKHDIAFLNRDDEKGREIIFTGKIIHADNSIYFINTYIASISPENEILNIQYSQFGKLIGSSIVMQCISRESDILILPETVTGNSSDLRSSVPLRPGREVIPKLTADENRFKKMETSFIAENLSLLNSSGYGGISASEEIIIRFVRFFNFIFIQLLVLASGISFMKRNNGRNYALFLSLPAAVILIYLAENGIIFIKTGIIRIFLTEAGLAWSIAAYSVITFSEIAAALAYTVNKGKQQH